jgi:FkbM family methyltransferase
MQRHAPERGGVAQTAMRRVRRFARFDAWELLLAVAFSALLGWVAARSYYSVHDETRAFRALYGRARLSQHDEEIFIRDFFGSRRGGFFLDVGANDFRRYNNTYLLETELGWSGIAVDALEEFAAGYLQHRKRTKFFTFFVSDVSDADIQFWAREGDTLLASSDRHLAGTGAAARKVQTITLNDLLERNDVRKVDFVNMDIELAEPKALAGFDVSRFRPDLVCVEAHLAVRQAILDYFASQNYVIVGRYLRADQHNLYFTPMREATAMIRAKHD